jgi:hypothetical protein
MPPPFFVNSFVFVTFPFAKRRLQIAEEIALRLNPNFEIRIGTRLR